MRSMIATSLAAVAFSIVAAIGASAAAPAKESAAIADARALLPKEAPPKERYVRYYLLKTIRNDGDLPFTTSTSFRLPRPRRVWVAVFVLSKTGAGPTALRVLRNASQMPQVVHGGCQAVNLVADAVTGETLGSWCNIDDGPPVNGMPPPLPVYVPSGSPFR